MVGGLTVWATLTNGCIRAASWLFARAVLESRISPKPISRQPRHQKASVRCYGPTSPRNPIPLKKPDK